ncbi:UvrB/uvrC motif containing protein, putative [Leishmania donovani]|uniref:UvrB/uvrC motif containing protein, putative n=1 Tax=Leishmania donovani TaxID=5661 RepID=A0A3S7WVF9_LEIDO|nr:UvrB/uvrC motif containing protein, putative [Leishmania donovani]
MFHSEAKYGPRLHMYLCHVSSHDEVHPADALRAQDGYSCGWVSRKHASYPQEMGFRFDGIVLANTLRILANENKISSCMVVYVAEPTAQEEQDGVCGPYSKAAFKRLGHVSFSNNAASNYQARELKTVGLQRCCTYLKLVLRNPHPNGYNIFQQVGVVALAVYGNLLKKLRDWIDTPLAIHVGECATVPLDEMMPPTHNEYTPGTPARVTGKLVTRISELAAMKQKAVEEEDFDAAEALRQQIITIENGEREVAQLELEKQRAVALENYKLAKELKLRIETLRVENEKIAAAPPKTAPSAMAATDAFPSPPQHRSPTVGASGSAAAQEKGNDTASSRPVQGGWNAHDEVVVGGKGYYDLSDATGGLTGKQPSARNGADEDEVPLSGDGTAWEVALNTAIKRVSTAPAGPSPLTGDAAAAAKPYTKDLGVYCVACLFSRKGQQREAALRGAVSSDGCQALASHSIAAWTQLVLYMSVKGYGVGDQVAGAAIAACNALTKIVQGKLPGASANQVAESVTKVLPELTARLGESNARVQESVEKTVVAVARSPLGHRRIVELLLVDPDKQNKKPASVRAHVSRINILSTFVDEFGLARNAPDGLDTHSLCSMVLLPSLQHFNADVRLAAVDLLAKLLFLDPSSTSGYLEDIKPVQQALIEEQLEQYKQSQLAAGSIARKVSDMQVDTVAVQSRGRGSPVSPQAQPQRSSAPRAREASAAAAEEADSRVHTAPLLQQAPALIGAIEYRRLRTCQFCGEYNSSFNEHNLDLHYVSACPMLCPCPLCDQVTEICQLQQHLVTECEKRRLVRECPRCHEAVRATEYNEHLAAKKCIEAVPTYSVCPLCHERFKNSIDEWRHHLASSPGCPNNPRCYDGSGLAM